MPTSTALRVQHSQTKKKNRTHKEVMCPNPEQALQALNLHHRVDNQLKKLIFYGESFNGKELSFSHGMGFLVLSGKQKSDGVYIV